MMQQYYDFKMHYKLTVELDGGVKLEKEYDNFGNFILMYHILDSRLENDSLDSVLELPGKCSVKLTNVRGLKGEYVEYPLEA